MSDLPPPVLPFWLDPHKEWTDADEHLSHSPPAGPLFILAVVDAFMAEGLDVVQAIEATSNSCQETGFGKHRRANNLGGVKIWRGDEGRWWKAPGHIKSGDPVWCFYKAYPSLQAYAHYWVHAFLPKPGTAPKSRYKKTGELFWNHDTGLHGWFAAMIAAGYKGDVTRHNPDPSDHAEETIDLKVEEVVAQRYLKAAGLYDKTIDGVWGAGSEAACKVFQHAHALPETGAIDYRTLWSMAHPSDTLPAWLAPRALPVEVVPEPAKDVPQPPRDE